MKPGHKKENGELTGDFAQELKQFVEKYLQFGAFEGAIADHLEGMAHRVRGGGFIKEVNHD